LQQVSGTNNGKTATPDQQQRVLEQVRQLEKSFPPPSSLLTDAAQAQALEGTWYLQYTSPSDIKDADESAPAGDSPQSAADSDVWKAQYAEQEGVERRPALAKGTVSAAGIRVETANRVVTQTIDTKASRVYNEIALDWGTVFVAGQFRPSDLVPNRAVVAFDTAEFRFKNGFTLSIGFLFSTIALFRGTADSGWLETTFVDEDVRIGRGNKGTMFVLTRDAAAVAP
jgi:PAP_fibrillin